MDVGRDVLLKQEQFSSEDYALDRLNFLLAAEWVVVLAAMASVDWGVVRARGWERAVGLILIGLALFTIADGSRWMIAALCALIAVKLVLQPGLLRLGAAIAVIAVEFLPSHMTFVHSLWARVDALATHALLTAAGYPNVLSGASVALQGATSEIVVGAGCSTSTIVPGVISAFLVFALCWRAPLRTIWRGLAMAVGGSFIINVLRLALMAQSHDDYEYWHNGAGAAIMSLATAALAYYTAQWASRAGPSWGASRSAEGEFLSTQEGDHSA